MAIETNEHLIYVSFFTINDLIKRLTTVSKNVEALSEMVKTIDQILDAEAAELKNSNEEKEKMDESVENQRIGKPSGDSDTKKLVIC